MEGEGGDVVETQCLNAKISRILRHNAKQGRDDIYDRVGHQGGGLKVKVKVKVKVRMGVKVEG